MSTPEGPTDGEGFAVNVSGLRKSFGARVALVDLSLRLGPGQIFGAVGANGGGKTTALRLLAGLLPPDVGSGRILGVDLRAHPTRLRECVGYMTQHHSLYRDLTVSENLLARARIYAVPDPHRRVGVLLERFGLERFARERVGQLSGGWMRRTQFAATLVPAPRLLLLDEPTAGLDLETSRRLWESVVELAAAGTTVIISTHDLVEAGRCDAVGVFVEGRVVARGTVEEVIRDSGVQVGRIPADGVDLLALRAAVPELAFARLGTRHHDLVFRTEPGARSLAWMRARDLSPEPRDPGLEDAMSVLVNPDHEPAL